MKRLSVASSTIVVLIFFAPAFSSQDLTEEEKREKQAAYAALQNLVHKFRDKIDQHWVNRDACSGQEVTLAVRLNINGEVISVKAIENSGDDPCRRSAKNAIDKASPLPFPKNPRFFKWLDREFQIRFKRDD